MEDHSAIFIKNKFWGYKCFLPSLLSDWRGTKVNSDILPYGEIVLHTFNSKEEAAAAPVIII